MEITGENIGKKFGRHWVFRNLDFQINNDSFVGIAGRNGSGKSTLLQIISGYLSPSQGEIRHNGKIIDPDHFELISFIGPSVELPEEFTLDEFLDFHSHFRQRKISNKEIAEKSNLPLQKRIAEFSTGMKQRTQLCTCFYYENSAILMDEPTANLDEDGFSWWADEVSSGFGIPIVLASNSRDELKLAKETIQL